MMEFLFILSLLILAGLGFAAAWVWFGAQCCRIIQYEVRTWYREGSALNSDGKQSKNLGGSLWSGTKVSLAAVSIVVVGVGALGLAAFCLAIVGYFTCGFGTMGCPC